MSTKPGVAFSFLLLQCIPETFTTDYRIHWNSHPLRPESVESTYFLHKTTGDSHYLEVGRTILTNFEKYARVPYDYAAVSDVSTGQHEEIFLLASNLTPQVANLKQQITNLQKQIDNTMILLKSYRIEIECIQLLVDLINKIYEINRDSGSNFKQMEERLLVLLDEESDGYQLVDEIQKEINKLEAEKTRLITNKENL